MPAQRAWRTKRPEALARSGRKGSVKQRPPGLLLAALFDIFDDVADRLELLGVLIRNFHPELFFERHDKLDRIERVGSQIFDERGCQGNLLGINSQLLDDDVFDFFFNGFSDMAVMI